MSYIGGVIKIEVDVVYDPYKNGSYSNTIDNVENANNNNTVTSVMIKDVNPASSNVSTENTSDIKPSVIINIPQSEDTQSGNTNPTQNNGSNSVGVTPVGFLANLLNDVRIVKNNPVEVAQRQIELGKNLIDTILNNFAEKLNEVRIYERRRENLYTYSAVVKGDNLKARYYLRQTPKLVTESLYFQNENVKIRESVKIENNNRVTFSAMVETQNQKLRVYFRGTEANYTYSLVWKRKKQEQPVEGVTIGSAYRQGDKIYLTHNAYGEREAFGSNQKVDLTKDFTVKANLYLGNRSQGTDGIAFVIQNSPEGRNALGMNGWRRFGL